MGLLLVSVTPTTWPTPYHMLCENILYAVGRHNFQRAIVTYILLDGTLALYTLCR